jgi:hypothetical protein
MTATLFKNGLIFDGNPLEDLSLLYEGQKGIDSVYKAGKLICSR